MLLRVANDCTNRLTIQPSVDEPFTFGARFDVCCIDRAIYIEESPTGNTYVQPHHYKNNEYGPGLCRKLKTRLPAFSMSDAEFALDGLGFRWQIPPTWELPWSRYAPRRKVEANVRYNLQVRCDSAREAGVDLRIVVQNVPKWARGVLSPREWSEIVQGVPV